MSEPMTHARIRAMLDPREQLEPLIRSLDERRVAELSGIPRASINNWLRGVRPMSSDRVKQIIAAMIEHHRGQIEALRKIKSG